MSLQGQGVKAYKSYMDRVMTKTPPVEKPMSGGLMNRNKSMAETNGGEGSSDYLMDQFAQLQKLRAGLSND